MASAFAGVPLEKKLDKRGLLNLGYGYGHSDLGVGYVPSHGGLISSHGHGGGVYGGGYGNALGGGQAIYLGEHADVLRQVTVLKGWYSRK